MTRISSPCFPLNAAVETLSKYLSVPPLAQQTDKGEREDGGGEELKMKNV
jgi:hypothetical protein